MEKHIPGKNEVIIKPARGDELRDFFRIAEKPHGKPEPCRNNGKEEEHVAHLQSPDRFETIEKNEPEDKIDPVIQHHPEYLAYETGPILKSRGNIQFPELNEKTDFA